MFIWAVQSHTYMTFIRIFSLNVGAPSATTPVSGGDARLQSVHAHWRQRELIPLQRLQDVQGLTLLLRTRRHGRTERGGEAA